MTQYSVDQTNYNLLNSTMCGIIANDMVSTALDNAKLLQTINNIDLSITQPKLLVTYNFIPGANNNATGNVSENIPAISVADPVTEEQTTYIPPGPPILISFTEINMDNLLNVITNDFSNNLVIQLTTLLSSEEIINLNVMNIIKQNTSKYITANNLLTCIRSLEQLYGKITYGSPVNGNQTIKSFVFVNNTLGKIPNLLKTCSTLQSIVDQMLTNILVSLNITGFVPMTRTTTNPIISHKKYYVLGGSIMSISCILIIILLIWWIYKYIATQKINNFNF